MQRSFGMALGALLMACCLPTAGFGAVPTAVCIDRANAALAAITVGNFTTAGTDFSAATAAALPAAKLKDTWKLLEIQTGDYVSHSAVRTQQFMGRPVVVVPLKFARAPLDFVVGCDAANRIEMINFLQPYIVSKPASVKEHVEADGVRIEPLSVPSKFGLLRGALTLPAGKGPFPGVVLVGGSGPNNLDEAVGGAKPFRDIANGLAMLGIATLRYDKRQYDYPLQMSANAHLTVDDEETDDAVSAAHLLASQKAIDPQRVFVLGHSEGGMLAPRIGQRDPDLAGLILAAAPERSLLAVMKGQVREQDQRRGLQAAIAAIEKALADEQALLAKADPQHPPDGSFSGAPQTWWLSLHDYDQVAAAKTLKMPMLFVQGGSDFQVSPIRDFDAWKTALAGWPNVTFRLFPGLSHLFTPAGKTLTPADYVKPAQVDPAVIALIARWVKAQAPARAMAHAR